MREVGDDPVRYLRSRQQDVLGGQDRGVHPVGDVADEVGLSQVQVAGLLQDRPVIGDLVRPMTGQRPLLSGDPTPDAQQAPAAQQGADAEHDSVQAPDKEASAGKARVRYAAGPFPATGGGPAHERADLCPSCRGDDRTPSPGPALPSGQDGPRGGGSAGGHPFAPVADLLNRQYPAAPTVADAGTFRRTALSDVAAPGGPSIVPD
ncbi:hypothetical protein [Actinomadura sp. WMMA1423]|uniref:hypothetical protein n=1 Tax=Actinomadura sp. WMMA1423 TaxID=2591108 RepID=UPI0011464695|nr:hypothetical protein [Actinomadura sp. WMMA1423]